MTSAENSAGKKTLSSSTISARSWQQVRPPDLKRPLKQVDQHAANTLLLLFQTSLLCPPATAATPRPGPSPPETTKPGGPGSFCSCAHGATWVRRCPAGLVWFKTHSKTANLLSKSFISQQLKVKGEVNEMIRRISASQKSHSGESFWKV